MGTLLVTEPEIEPITYQQVIDHLRITAFDEDMDGSSVEYFDTLIAAVRADAEDFTNRKFITQTWKYYLDEWPKKNYIEFPFSPVQSVTSINVLINDVPVTALDSNSYLVDAVSLKNRIVLAYESSWPSETLFPVNPIEIEFICGYGNLAEDVPARIRQAILIQIADLYENRETIVQGQPIQRLDTYERLLGPFRIFWL